MKTRKHRCRPMRLFLLASVVFCLAVAGLARADIYRWDNGQLIPGTEGITPGPATEIGARALQFAELSNTNLTRSSFYDRMRHGSDLTGARFTNSNLSYTVLAASNLSGADFAGATIIGTYLWATQGFTKEQLYSTASYQAKDLHKIGLGGLDLSGWELSGQGLTGATFSRSTLTNTNLAGAYLTNAYFDGATLTKTNLAGAYLTDAYFDGATLTNANLAGAHLTEASLYGATLTNANLAGAYLTNAFLREATLTNTNLAGAFLTNADFARAVVAGANFARFDYPFRPPGSGITLSQLYSTASYEQRNLRGINLRHNDLTSGGFSGQDLTGVNFGVSTLTDAILAGAIVRGANFSYTLGFTKEQLYSTASYQQRDLRGIGLSGNNLTGWDFSKQDLTDADFAVSALTNANLAGAIITGAQFGTTGITREQLYSTASYKQKNLRGIGLGGAGQGNDLTGWDFSEQDLTGANLSSSTLTNANLSGTNLTNAWLGHSTLRNANFAGAMVAGAGFGFYENIAGFTKEQLYSTASYQQKDLRGILLRNINLTGWDFSGQDLTGASFIFSMLWNANLSGANLTDASFSRATLTNANLAGAMVAGAYFDHHLGYEDGITLPQLYSTASYQQKNLRGIGLSGHDLASGDFSGQDLSGAILNGSRLTNANLSGTNLTHAVMGGDFLTPGATLTNANLTRADARGAGALNLTAAITTNLIRPDGRIVGLNLAAGEKLVAYPGVPIPVTFGADFSIARTAILDLTDNAAIVDNQGTSTAAAVREQIISGRGGSGPGGEWTGTGITSSTAAAANEPASDSRSLGYADNATLPLGPYTTFHGAPVDNTAVLIAFTRTGDANLDGLVNDDDVTIIGGMYAPGIPQPSWALGDFDYNGFVDDDDVTLLNALYDPSAPPLNSPIVIGDSSSPAAPGAGGELHSGVSAVPEPSTAILVLLILVIGAAARVLRRGRYGLALVVAVVLTTAAAAARADIFRWDDGQLIPGTEGITPGPGVNLSSQMREWSSPQRNLRFADFSGGLDFTEATFAHSWLDNSRFNGANLTNAVLVGASLTNADLSAANLTNVGLAYTNLTNADLSGTNLTNARLEDSCGLFCIGGAILTNANLAGAVVAGADFSSDLGITRITLPQLYSTASYQQRNLRGIGLSGHDLTSGDFSGQDLSGAGISEAVLTNTNLAGANLTGASLSRTIFTNANLTGAVVTRANLFYATDFTREQLYSTASYQQRDLNGINLSENDLTGWDFSGQDLTGADFSSSMLTNANLAGANLTNAALFIVTNADLAGAIITGAGFHSVGFSSLQLYSTASYQQRNLRGIRLDGANLTSWDFSGQDLTGASFSSSTLTNANFAGAVVAGAHFVRTVYPWGVYGSGITLPQLYSTASYQQKNLRGIGLRDDLTGGNFSGQDLSGAILNGSRLTNADLSGANLTDAALLAATLTSANFAGAVVAGANFSTFLPFPNPEPSRRGSGITLPQLYSTDSYQQRNLRGIGLGGNDLTGGDFSGQDLSGAILNGSRLTNANLSGTNLTHADMGGNFFTPGATLTGANLTGADARGAGTVNLTAAITTNLIRPDGRIVGLNLAAGEKLVAYPGVPIPVKFGADFSIAPTAILDLTDNAAIVDNAATSTVSAIREHIISGRGGSGAGGEWTGTGITSSTAAAANGAQPDSWAMPTTRRCRSVRTRPFTAREWTAWRSSSPSRARRRESRAW